jgi:hypothetical protein
MGAFVEEFVLVDIHIHKQCRGLEIKKSLALKELH